MSTVSVLQREAREIAHRLQLCQDIEAGLMQVTLMESAVAWVASQPPVVQQGLARQMQALLQCQERQDWLGLADFLAWEWCEWLSQCEAGDNAS